MRTDRTDAVPWFFGSLRGYQGSWLRMDLVAGLTVWAVLVPESLAYATIAGVSPVVGLYAAVPSLVLYALLGSSRHLIVGPMSATAALSAGIVAVYAKAGSDQYVGADRGAGDRDRPAGAGGRAGPAGLRRRFISEPVLKGFIVGLALTIMVGQVPALLGIPKGRRDFFEKLWHVITDLGSRQCVTAAVGFGAAWSWCWCCAVSCGCCRARWSRCCSASSRSRCFTSTPHGVDVVGHITRGLPPFGLPRRCPRTTT